MCSARRNTGCAGCCWWIAIVLWALNGCYGDPLPLESEGSLPAAITVLPDSVDSSALGDTVRLHATVLDGEGEAIPNATVTWVSSKSSVAAVDFSGLVTAVGNGDGRVVASAGMVSTEVPITVHQVPDSVAVSPTSLALSSLGELARLTAVVTDRNGHAIAHPAVAWHSTVSAVATVSVGGSVISRGNGQTTVTATARPVLTEVPVTVEQVPVSIKVRKPVELLRIGHAVQLEAIATDANRFEIDSVTVQWSSADATVASVDVNGLVRGENVGVATITAAAGEVSDSVNLEIVRDAERDALVALWHSANGAAWVDSENWLSQEPVSEWYGVSVDSTGRIVGLRLARNNVSGALPSALGDLVHLRTLALQDNGMVGRLPVGIGNLRNLEELYLFNNGLVGEMPETIALLRRLKTLNVGANNLAGAIPYRIGELTNLRSLNLAGNEFTGALPPSMVDLRALYRLAWDGSEVCAPGASTFRIWLDELQEIYGGTGDYFCDREDRTALVSFYHSTDGPGWSERYGWLDEGPLDEWYGVTTDSIGLVTKLEVARNGLAGDLPATVANLSRLVGLWMGGNQLTGRLPSSLTTLSLHDLHFGETSICVPTEELFQEWMSSITSFTGTDLDCAPVSDRDALVALYQSANGESWRRSDNWLSDRPLGTWYGVASTSNDSVTAVRLAWNNLVGVIPREMGRLTSLESLQLNGNHLSGNIPEGIGSIGSLTTLALSGNSLTGRIPPEIGKLVNLVDLRLDGNQLSGTIPDEMGNLTKLRTLSLARNRLEGSIPEAIGRLRSLDSLYLNNNHLTGSIPAEIGGLGNLKVLSLSSNRIGGAIPRRMGDLGQLKKLLLYSNRLTGAIPPTIGRLANLTTLRLDYNDLDEAIPKEIGDLRNLHSLHLHGNRISGRVPPQLGRLENLQVLSIHGNILTGELPAEMSGLTNLSEMDFRRNMLSGSLPVEIGNISGLQRIWGSGNPDMAGPLPSSMTRLHNLRLLMLSDTKLCAPSELGFTRWLDGVRDKYVGQCSEDTGTPFYFTQAIQSLLHPVPLIAGDPALLRVFVTSDKANDTKIPPFRASFFNNDGVIHTVEVDEGAGTIPMGIDEGSLDESANADVPGWVIQPGLEVVIEVDPEGTVDSALGIRERIPESGRVEVDVRAVPKLDLTVIPFLWDEDPDYSVVRATEELDADHRLMFDTRVLLPVGEVEVSVHEEVWTGVDPTFENRYRILSETGAIRAAEGAQGHYMGLFRDGGGIAYVGGRVSASALSGYVIAHELGHNMSLLHAPCGFVAHVDPSYPHEYGTIGVWGYDPRQGKEIPPTVHDLMSYCSDWISDYSFKKALRFREAAGVRGGFRRVTASLLVWGGKNEDGDLVLEPSFVVDAPALLPANSGPYRVSGHDVAGSVLFSLDFEMPQTADGGDEVNTFAFSLPAGEDWEKALVAITLTGPEGSVSIAKEGRKAVALLWDRQRRQVRGFLGDWGSVGEEVTGDLAGLEVQVSRGVPAARYWRR